MATAAEKTEFSKTTCGASKLATQEYAYTLDRRTEEIDICRCENRGCRDLDVHNTIITFWDFQIMDYGIG